MSTGSDVHRVMSSLPRSGTHWVKLLISHLLGEPPLDERVLDPERLQLALREDSTTRLIYDHFEFDIHGSILDTARYPNLKMIILFRHPLDSLISMYYKSANEKSLHDNTKGPIENLRMFLNIHKNNEPFPECFKKHPRYLLLERRDYFRFFIRNYVIDWLEFRECLSVRYEDLLSDAKGELMRIADYLAIPYSQHHIEDAIDRYNFKKLSGGREPGAIDPQSHFRQGTAGEWRNVMTNDDLAIVHQQIGDYLLRMGYSIS